MSIGTAGKRRSKTRELEAALIQAQDRIRALEAHVLLVTEADGGVECGPCTRCGYGPWRSVQPPITCPRCKSAYWNRPRVRFDARKPGDPPLNSWNKKGQTTHKT